MTASSNLPSQIRGLLQLDPDSPTIELRSDLAMPVPDFTKDEHLVKVHATSPCSNELNWTKMFPSILEGGKTLVPCYDLAGLVVQAPENSKFPPGTEVWTRTTAWRTGNAREYSIAVSAELSKKPSSLSWAEAASVPLSGFTAYQLLFTKGGLPPGWKNEKAYATNADKKIVVTAAAGGVGTVVLQLAKAAGIGSIVAQTGPTNVDFVESLGATEVVNYREKSLAQWAETATQKADLVIDMIGGQTLQDCWKCVKDNGVLLGIRDHTMAKNRPQGKDNVRCEFFVMTSDGWQLDEMGALIEKGELKAVVDSVWKLDDYQKAFDIVEGGHARGKVIIEVQ